MNRFATQRFGRNWFEHLLDYLGLSHSPSLEHARSYFFSWSFFLMPVRGRRIAEWYLEDRGSCLSEEERAFLFDQLDAWPTLWEVVEIRPGEGVGLRDLLSGAEVFLNDHNASKSVMRYHVLLARVVKLGHIAIMGGAHPNLMPPLEAQSVVEAARRLHGRRTRAVSDKSLRSFERAAELFRLWDGAVRVLCERPGIPRLQNTDGEPLLLTSDYFVIAAGELAHVRAAIAAMEGADPDSDEPESLEFVISKPGNAAMAAMEPASPGWC